MAIWFDSPDNLEFGLGYSTVKTYDNPASRLTFLGASVRAATREEFEVWYNSENKNLITSEMVAKRYWTENGWLRDAPAILPDACYSLALADVRPEDRVILDKYWPEDRPNYWSRTQISQETYSAIYSESDLAISVGLLDRLKLNDGRLRLDRSKFRSSDAAPKTVKSYPAYYSDSVPALRAGKGNYAPIIRLEGRWELEGFSACYERFRLAEPKDGAGNFEAYRHYSGAQTTNGIAKLMVSDEGVLEAKYPHDLNAVIFFQNMSVGKIQKYNFRKY